MFDSIFLFVGACLIFSAGFIGGAMFFSLSRPKSKVEIIKRAADLPLFLSGIHYPDYVITRYYHDDELFRGLLSHVILN